MSFNEEEGKGKSTEIDFDINRDTPPIARTSKFLRIEQGSRKIRLLPAKGKHYRTHWLPVQKKTALCEGQKCPHCRVNVPSKHETLFKVIDRETGKLMVMALGTQVLNQVMAQRVIFSERAGNTTDQLTDYNLVVIRGPKGSNPLYQAVLREKVGPEQNAEDLAALKADKTNLTDFMRKPLPPDQPTPPASPVAAVPLPPAPKEPVVAVSVPAETKGQVVQEDDLSIFNV
jgi:hypothetical protein